MSDSIEVLQERRKCLYKALKSSTPIVRRARVLLESLEKRYARDRKAFEECEYELALLDGRKTVVSEKGKHSKVREMTYDELAECARRLGYDIEALMAGVKPVDDQMEDAKVELTEEEEVEL